MEILVFQTEGNANDLLVVDDEHSCKQTRLILDTRDSENDEEILDVTITSTDPTRTHPLFNNSILGKRIKITVEEIDDGGNVQFI